MPHSHPRLPLLLLGAALLLGACSPSFGGGPDREVIVLPPGTTVVPAR